MKEELLLFESMEALAKRAVELAVAAAEKALAEKGSFHFAISGGSSPLQAFKLLASSPMPWKETHVWQVDERFVPESDPLNNFAAAKEAFLSKVPLPPENVHRMKTELPSPQAAAEAYSKELESFFGGAPRFDLLQLGMGDDGHFASLFPRSPLLDSRSEFALAAPAPTSAKPEVPRVTLSLRALNAAEEAFFILQGPRKRSLLESFFGAPRRPEALRETPASAAAPRKRLLWLLLP